VAQISACFFIFFFSSFDKLQLVQGRGTIKPAGVPSMITHHRTIVGGGHIIQLQFLRPIKKAKREQVSSVPPCSCSLALSQIWGVVCFII